MHQEHQELLLENFQVEELEERLEMAAGPVVIEAGVDKDGPYGKVTWTL